MAANRAKIEARMDSLAWQPEREDLEPWIEMSPALAESQRKMLLARYREGGTVRQLIRVFQDYYELDEEQLDSWYEAMDQSMDDYEER